MSYIPTWRKGARYGNLALRMLVVWLSRNYRFSTDLRMEDLHFRMDITLKLLNGHMVRVQRREPFWMNRP